jgi:hypothetical protein
MSVTVVTQDMQALSQQPFCSSSSPQHQQLQYQQVQNLLARPVLPQSPLRPAAQVHGQQGPMDAAEAAGMALPHSLLAFPEYGGPRPPQ